MRFKGCLIALAVGLGIGAVLLGIFGPTLVREAGRFYAPISKMKTTQTEFETWAEQHPWQEPATPELPAERLAVFLKLRGELHALEAQIDIPQPGSRAEKPKLKDMPQLFEGIGGAVTGQLSAHQNAGMTPKEYHYIERLIYRRWLPALRQTGADPAARSRAAAEIDSAAEKERDAVLKGRLQGVAQRLRAAAPPAPEGIPEAIHVLLLAHAQELQGLSESTFPFGVRQR